MQLDDLSLFLRLAHVQSLSEAARQLDQTPSSVSARLKRIEGEVGIAIRYGELRDSSMVGRLLARTNRVLVAAPAYLDRSPPLHAPADLANHRCLAWLSRDQPKVQWSLVAPDGATETVVVKPT